MQNDLADDNSRAFGPNQTAASYGKAFGNMHGQQPATCRIKDPATCMGNDRQQTGAKPRQFS